MSTINNIIGLSEKEYGDKYRDHVLEIYKLYVEQADHISARRLSANSFFLTLNSAIAALVGYVNVSGISQSGNMSFFWVVAIAGMIISFLWYRLLRAYKDINAGKFKIIHEIEQYLPLHPYDAEWIALGEGKNPKLYLPFTHIEIYVPWVFFGLHLFVLITSIL